MMTRKEMIDEIVEIYVIRYTDENDMFFIQEKLRTIFREGYVGYKEHTTEELKELLLTLREGELWINLYCTVS